MEAVACCLMGDSVMLGAGVTTELLLGCRGMATSLFSVPVIGLKN